VETVEAGREVELLLLLLLLMMMMMMMMMMLADCSTQG
jgi:hypothetical protein